MFLCVRRQWHDAPSVGRTVKTLAKVDMLHVPYRGAAPAIAETLPGFDINSWTALTGPAKLPADVTARLSELSRKALVSEDLKVKFLDRSATAIWRSPTDTLAYRESEEKRWHRSSRHRAPARTDRLRA